MVKGQINLQGGGKKKKKSIYIILRKIFQILKEEENEIFKKFN